VESGPYSIQLARIEGFDAVVNLAGESIAEGRWTEERSGASVRAVSKVQSCWRCAGKFDESAEDFHLRLRNRLLREPRRRGSDGK